jgi:peptidylprolyl isomerase/FKBP-type peptidyl-prolyl cis-trans isomerase FklB
MIRVVALCTALALAACARAETEAPAVAPPDAAAKNWLAENKRERGVVTLPSGIQYRVVRAGPVTGVKPDEDDLVKVHYEGTLTDGTEFDSSYREGRPLIARPGMLIPGWAEVLQLMRPGDEWRVFIPPELGYGEQGAGPIPPHSVLVFRMELLDVLPREGE